MTAKLNPSKPLVLLLEDWHVMTADIEITVGGVNTTIKTDWITVKKAIQNMSIYAVDDTHVRPGVVQFYEMDGQPGITVAEYYRESRHLVLRATIS
tara:strand:+ start:723 stop:1010 length:288 start_codon:yes stop_codon:yes gene_type:complete